MELPEMPVVDEFTDSSGYFQYVSYGLALAAWERVCLEIVRLDACLKTNDDLTLTDAPTTGNG